MAAKARHAPMMVCVLAAISKGVALLLGLFVLAGASGASAMAGSPGCEAEMLAAARRHGLPVNILYAVALTESGSSGALQPFALNVDGVGLSPQSLEVALAAVKAAEARGARFIDIGCMQVNRRFHGQAFSSLSAMFEPRANVDYAARFLKELRAREGSWTMAVARYNAGPGNAPAQKKYVCAVIGRMVSSGFGAWTPAAKRFCNQE